MNKLIAALAFAACSHAAWGQVPTSIVTSADDTTGARLAYELKERVLSSRQFSQRGNDTKGWLQINLVTLDPTVGKLGQSTIYSAVCLWNSSVLPFPLYLGGYVGSCPVEKVVDCAQTIAASAIQSYEASQK